MTTEQLSAVDDFNRAWYDRDLARQVQAIQRMAQRGMSMRGICGVTNCTPVFIQSLLGN